MIYMRIDPHISKNKNKSLQWTRLYAQMKSDVEREVAAIHTSKQTYIVRHASIHRQYQTTASPLELQFNHNSR